MHTRPILISETPRRQKTRFRTYRKAHESRVVILKVGRGQSKHLAATLEQDAQAEWSAPYPKSRTEAAKFLLGLRQAFPPHQRARTRAV